MKTPQFGTMLTKYGTHVVTRRDVRRVGRASHSLLRLASGEHFAYRFEAEAHAEALASQI
jgi:hypothetical protein